MDTKPEEMLALPHRARWGFVMQPAPPGKGGEFCVAKSAGEKGRWYVGRGDFVLRPWRDIRSV